jgi:ribosomal-protein-alanine N-acetyltransferase
VTDVGIAGEEGELGYWFERAAWGSGHATEAACALVAFVFSRAGLSRLRSGHAADNPGSGRVLGKLGFRLVARAMTFSRSRGQEIAHWRYALERPAGLESPAT